MAARPKLSILVPTYNRKDMLAECLDSVLPTTADCEIAVFDDASTDGTAELLTSYEQCDARVRVIRQPANVGAVANLATAFREARGEFMALLPDDDAVLPGNYEKKLALLEAHPDVDLAYSLAYVENEPSGTRQVIRCWQHLDYSYVGGRDEFHDLIGGDHIPTPSVVFRRRLYDERGGFADDVPPELTDWDLWLRYTYGSQTAFINEPLVNVRVQSSSLSFQKSAAAPIAAIALWRKWLVDRKPPIVLGRGTWDRMSTTLKLLAENSYPDRPEKIDDYMSALDQLRRDAAASASRQFAIATRAPHLAEPETAASATLPALAWSGPVFALDEDGSDLRACALAAESAGLRLRFENLHRDRAVQLPLQEAESLFARTWTPIQPQGYLQVCHSLPRYFERPPDALAVAARTAWSTDRLPEDWVRACNQMDAVWAPSRFHCDTFAASGVDPDKLRLLPGGIESSRYGNGASGSSVGTGRSFNFLAVVDWSLASGVDVLVKAFAQEFRPDEDVALMLLVRLAASHQQEILRAVQELVVAQIGARPCPSISLQLELLSEASMASLFGAAQAYVQPNRAASWGRALMQAMAGGLPAVATAWGDNLDLLAEGNGYPVECQLVGVPPGALPELADAAAHRWAEPSLEHLRARLREVFTQREEAASRGQTAQCEISARRDVGVVGRQLRQLVAELV